MSPSLKYTYISLERSYKATVNTFCAYSTKWSNILQTCQGAEIFKGEIFTSRGGRGILISRFSKTPIFAFSLCDLKNKKTVSTQNWEEWEQELNPKSFQVSLLKWAINEIFILRMRHWFLFCILWRQSFHKSYHY